MKRRRKGAVFFDVYRTLIHPPNPAFTPQTMAKQAERVGLWINVLDLTEALPKLEEMMREKSSQDRKFAQLRVEDRREYWEYWYQTLLSLVGVRSNLREYASALFGEYLFSDDFALDPDAFTVLATLEPKYALGIISNASARLGEILVQEGLMKFVSVAIISDVVGVEKPDPRIYQMGMAALGYAPSESFFVGDNLTTDVLGSRRVGMWPIWYNREGNEIELSCPQIRNLKELPELLERMTPDV